jgi:hypothetical protein
MVILLFDSVGIGKAMLPSLNYIKMIEQLEKLNQLKNTLNLDLFYSITFRKLGIDLQGNYDAELIKMLINLGYIYSIDSNGFMALRLDEVRVILT